MSVTTPASEFQLDAQGRWWIEHDKDALLDYSQSWVKWLAKISDSITSWLVVLPVASELTDEGSAESSPGIITISLSGGTTVGSYQAVTIRITTAAGRIDDRTFYLKIADR